ncbi:MAG TPA: phosphate acyltransferase PlsX [Caldisericia bacterium]|nr:phosphate acyltransferase PlsX [Caldisericia bacterium]HOU07908.1 phosphate acyltransferase PlsX [Caldisericia bacterium]HPL89285.1 phosphate acyltransferase PlsX [Caldisericia bacterium]HQG59959.1 phosphate acyltransferase PlsX [Caldisericia bacterium]HQH48857.1 phosphate acyltransferase PlsX [Caldisericia bacterium]
MIRIALDAMGGDHAPKEIISGAILARSSMELDITLIGDKTAIEEELKIQKSPFMFPVVHTTEVVTMNDHPSEVLRTKKDASIFVATRLVAEGRCDAIVSAGSTGAQLAAAIFILGRVRGIERPGVATPVPQVNGKLAMMCDGGAVSDCKPNNLLEFAQMSSAYCQNVMGIDNPRVALLNIGEEPEKGSELTQATHKLLLKSGLNFIGNIEGKDVLKGNADAIITDGFTGNVILKAIEGIASDVMGLVKKAAKTSLSSKMGGLLLLPAIGNIRKMMDYSEYGGAPLLGVNGISIICHGRSNGKAISSAIRQAVNCCNAQLISKISSQTR